MNITLSGTKVSMDGHTLAFQKNNLVDSMVITVDTDETWQYKLDAKYPCKDSNGKELYNVIDLTRVGNTCTAILQATMLPFNGKYTMQLRGISGNKVYHTDTFDVWVKYSIDPSKVYDPVPSEFYQIEQAVTEQAANAKQSANNAAESAAKAEDAAVHSPIIGENGNWFIWDFTKSEYVDTGIKSSGGGAVDDVQVNGTSVVADGVAKIPLAKTGSTGVVKFDEFMPFTFNDGALRLANADEKELTNPRYGYSTNRAITASNYRLAVKLAMCDGKGEAWTDTEKVGAWNRQAIIKTSMDEIAVAGAQYYLGEQSSVSVVLPDDAQVGQMVTVSWYNSATAATLSITGTMLAFDYTPSANTRSEINALWDGTYWAVLGNEMEVPSE